MIKKTLYFGNPAYLHKHLDQLVIETKTDMQVNETKQIPIEDIGMVVIDNPQITISHGLLQGLIENNAAIIICDNKRHPAGLMMPLAGNTIQTERFKDQIEASEPLRKQMWQQTVKSKILNQAALLRKVGANIKNMQYWADEVKSGDIENHEARAAAYYWSKLFNSLPFFRREREGIPPNNLLNYGYAILRAITARSLVASGLLPTLGIHHHNRYNAYCLADDIMEPYRPFVDEVVLEVVENHQPFEELTKEVKTKLLTIPANDVMINLQTSPLMIAAQITAASVYHCFEGSIKKIAYPELL